MTQVITKEDIKEFHLKKLEYLSIKTIGAVPWLDHPNEEEQAQWVKRRMYGSARSWEVWNQ